MGVSHKKCLAQGPAGAKTQPVLCSQDGAEEEVPFSSAITGVLRSNSRQGRWVDDEIMKSVSPGREKGRGAHFFCGERHRADSDPTLPEELPSVQETPQQTAEGAWGAPALGLEDEQGDAEWERLGEEARPARRRCGTGAFVGFITRLSLVLTVPGAQLPNPWGFLGNSAMGASSLIVFWSLVLGS